MRVPVEWLRQYVELPAELTTVELADTLTMLDLKLEAIHSVGAELTGPLVVGRVLSSEPEAHSNGKTVRWCKVDVGEDEPRGIVCGADNFSGGNLVVVSLPGATLPGGFVISARTTYGHVSDGMICSTAELGVAGDASGILVLDKGEAEVGDDAIALLGLRADVLELEVNPDRGYALSMRGVARDAAIGFKAPYTDPAALEVDATGESYPVRVEDTAACPVFVTRTVTGFDPSRPTPRWLARRVELGGMRPISLAVDITNYVMLELGQPIHGYDRMKLRGPVVVRRASPGEKLTTLDDVERTLTEADLLISDDSGPIGLAGVMGGQTTELSATTTDIVIEAAYFLPAMIAHTARVTKLPSEASKRFERGVDPALALPAAQRVANLLVEYGGGDIEDGVTVVGQTPTRDAIALPVGLPSRITGIDIERQTTVNALEANGCQVTIGDEQLSVTPPTWRPDLVDPYDLVEEVLRVVGYDQVPSILPVAPAGTGLTREQALRRRVSRALAGNGLIEVKTFPFAGPSDWDKLGFAADNPLRDQVLLENPLSAGEPGLTTTLLPGLLTTLALNIGRGHSDIAIYETGPVFLPKAGKPEAPILGVDRHPTAGEQAALDAALPAQPRHIALALDGSRRVRGWWGAGRPVEWADAVAAVREVARVLDVEIGVEAATFAPWHPGRCAAITVGGKVIGHAGELHPRVAKAYKLPGRTAIAEVDLDELVAAAPAVVDAPVFSTFPVAKEDIALVVDVAVPAAALENALKGASDLIESVRLFDTYLGDQVPEGKKSLAFAIRMRAADRTLADEEIKGVRDAALAAAAEATGATLRT